MPSPISAKLTRQYTVAADQPRLDLYLARETGETRAFIKSQLELGNVRVNQAIVHKGASKLHAGDTVEIQFTERISQPFEPIYHPLEILFEDEHILVLNKPQDMVMHPALGHRGETLVHYLLYHFKNAPDFLAMLGGELPRPGIVHRLDRGTSGVVVIGKNRTAVESLSRQFKDRTVVKIYEAIVWGKLDGKGSIRSVIGRDRSDGKKMSSRTNDGREAITHWESLFCSADFSHVRLFPKTGRTHQLRVHLSENAHAIVGDPLYGVRSSRKRLQNEPWYSARVAALKFPFLHACSLRFSHPATAAELEFSAPLPPSFLEFLDTLKAHA